MNGYVYTIGNNDRVEAYCEEDPDPAFANIIRKYNSSNGSLLWERKLPVGVGTPHNVVVSSNGNVYVVGSSGMSRYTPSGGLLWTKSSYADEVIISGPAIVTRTNLWIHAFSDTGTKRWSSFIGGLAGAEVSQIDSDSSGNVYVTGSYAASTNEADVFVRKLSANGKSQWTRKFGTPEYDKATGIATYDGSEIYVVGTTEDSLSPANDTSDGFLYKMSSIGNRVWVR